MQGDIQGLHVDLCMVLCRGYVWGYIRVMYGVYAWGCTTVLYNVLYGAMHDVNVGVAWLFMHGFIYGCYIGGMYGGRCGACHIRDI